MTVWERLVGFFVDAKWIVVVLLGLLVFEGLRVSPFPELDLGFMPRSPVPVDAIPDIGENQQIVFTEWPGRSPRDVEDQVTYPLTAALMGIPGVRTVRSSSAFGFSNIYVIFEDDAEFYWARARILEKLAALPAGVLPDGVTPTLGPDATGLGQVFWYTLEGRDESGRTVGGWDLHELRSVQDYTVRYALSAVDEVSEVSSIGGHVQEYQIDVNPDALRAFGVTLQQVADAVRRSNLDVGARTMEINRVEYVVRGLGSLDGLEDLREVVVSERDHTPVRLRELAHVHLGPAMRRGGLDDAGAEAVGGVVVARYRGNPLRVIEGVRERIAALAPSLPTRTLEDGTVSRITVVPFYDRSTLIHETIGTLSTALLQQILVAVIVVLVMLRNLRASLLIGAMLPLGVLFALTMMSAAGVDANLMALGGIAIAIGTMVDMGIVVAENIVQRLAESGSGDDRAGIVRRAAAEVAPAVVTSVLTTVISFLPVFALTAAEARLFVPLAFTKTVAMVGALALAIIVLPPAAHILMRPRPEAVRRGVARVRRSLFRPTHFRDWALVIAGLVLGWWNPWAASGVVFLGLTRLARPLLSPRASRFVERAEIVVIAIALTGAVAAVWRPLGFDRGIAANLALVAGIVVLTLGTASLLVRGYPVLMGWALARKGWFAVAPISILLFGVLAWLGVESVSATFPAFVREAQMTRWLAVRFPGLGREYLPSFDEGAFLYMPTAMPHASVGEVRGAIAEMDAAVAAIPEVDRVVGKWGRVESALDPAPVSMIETVITYRPEFRVESDGSRVRQWRDHIRNPQDIWGEIVRVSQRPGLTSAPVLMPIGARIVMLQSGMRAPMGIRVQGPDLESIEQFALRAEAELRQVPELRSETVFAERVVGKPYLEIDIDREAIARHGISIERVQETLRVALGGVSLTRTFEGRERYAVRVRYMREERDSVEALQEIMVDAPGRHAIPLAQLAAIRYVRGPQLIRSENTFPSTYVLFDRQGRVAEVDAVEAARNRLREAEAEGRLERPTGVTYVFEGSYRAQLRSEERLAVLIPIALALVFALLYLQFRRASTALFVYSGVVVSVSGAFILLWLYGQPWFLDFDVFGVSMREVFRVGTVNLSVAVWVGVIALIGIATDDGVVMSTYLAQRFGGDPPRTVAEVRQRVIEAGARRIRPCLMTTATTVLALLPVVTSRGRGSDLMAPMALPSIGGMGVGLISLFVVPVLYGWWEERRLRPSIVGAAPRSGGVPARVDATLPPEPSTPATESEE